MLISKYISTARLIHSNRANIYIYLRDHNRHINPHTSLLKVSYRNPANIIPQAPQQPASEYKLNPEMQELLDRQIFEEYKAKLLRGIIDEEPIKEPDPLWGQQQPPTHYFNRISKIDLMKVSHPHNLDAQPMIRSHFASFFDLPDHVQVTLESIANADIHQLVQLSLSARIQQIDDRQIWFEIENRLGRGKKLYLLSAEELVKLKWSFDNLKKQGTPVFHQILADLLRQDLPTMKKELLVSLYYACRYSNPGQTNLQDDIIQKLRPTFKSWGFQQKVKFLLAFATLSKPLKYNKKAHKRRQYEFKQKAGALLLELDFWNLQLNDQNVSELLFSLAKLHLENTKFISLPLKQYIEQNLESYSQEKDRLFQAVVYLGQLEAGQGILDQQLGTKLLEQIQPRWDQFTNIQRIRIVHALWTIGLMDDNLLELYKSVQFQADSSVLYYASQIEMQTSSEREWQIIQCLANIDYLPLPYYVAYKRFCNYIKSTTEWNLKPLQDKLINTEYHYSAMRQNDYMGKVAPYRKLRQFQKFTGLKFLPEGSPVQNLELCHYGMPKWRVSLDIVTKKEFIPGTNQLKETYLNKVRSLKSIGWKHLAYTEEQLKESTLAGTIQSIQTCWEQHVQEQRPLIEYQDYQEGKKIQMHKRLREISEWQLEEINQFVCALERKEYIEIGNEQEEEEMPEEKQEKAETPKKKKKK